MDDVMPEGMDDFLRDQVKEDMRNSGCTCDPEIEFDMQLIDTGTPDLMGAMGKATVIHTDKCALHIQARAWMN